MVADCGGRDDEMPPALLSCLDVLSPNKTELERLIGSWENEQEMNALIKVKLLDKYPQMRVLLKKGGEGCAFLAGEDCVSEPSVTQKNPEILNSHSIVDTTGAGDCFTAAFVVRYLELKEEPAPERLSRSLQFANAAAFLCITKEGAMPSLPSRSALDAFMTTL